MTIAERRAKEAYDREHPWRSIAHAGPDDVGMVCEARFSFHGAATEQGRRRYFTNGEHWFQISPPYQFPSWGLPMDFRSTGYRLSERRMRWIIARADWRNPHPPRRRPRYELYWRADDK